MAASPEMIAPAAEAARPERTAPPPRQRVPPAVPVALPWLRAQAINVNRHAGALRPFRRGEFGTGAASPSEGHLQAVNQLLSTLRRRLIVRTRSVTELARQATAEPTTERLQRLTARKEHAHNLVRTIEKVWDFYFELFGMRQSQFADWLLSCDRIALGSYQAVYMGLGQAKSIPAPPPFSYMRTGFAPATYRRGVPLSRIGRQLNPFPLIELPYHRLVNPWTLGAVLHEVSHNIQSDVGLSRVVPRAIALNLLGAGVPQPIAQTWTRWNRETFADLSALLLGGPAVVASLMDVIGRSLATVLTFNPRGVHPTPYFRTLISIELLKRLGFSQQAERFQRFWQRLYPEPGAGNIPRDMLRTFERANSIVVDTICFTPYQDLGGKALASVVRFEPKDQELVEEAARRIAAGTDPGIIPSRFLIAASRVALDRRLARPGAIAASFYTELARR